MSKHAEMKPGKNQSHFWKVMDALNPDVIQTFIGGPAIATMTWKNGMRGYYWQGSVTLTFDYKIPIRRVRD